MSSLESTEITGAAEALLRTPGPRVLLISAEPLLQAMTLDEPPQSGDVDTEAPLHASAIRRTADPDPFPLTARFGSA